MTMEHVEGGSAYKRNAPNCFTCPTVRTEKKEPATILVIILQATIQLPAWLDN